MTANTLLQVLLSYLLGSVLGSVLVGRLRGVDIRKLGSGNPGGTNALRTQGAAFAAAVLLIDAGKGYLAAGWLAHLSLLPGAPADTVLSPAGCAAAALTGHVLPVWHGWRGGKGVATIGGALAALSLPLLGVAAAIWIVVLAATRIVSLASLATAVLLPVAALLVSLPLERVSRSMPLLTFAAFAGAVVVLNHRHNLARLRAGVEPRLGRR